MKKLIITGCNGQLGHAVNDYYAGNSEFECVNTDVGELDITNVDDVLRMAREVKPYAIINCAAYTNVNKCESEKDLAFKINAIGPRNLAIASREVGAKLVQISTDYVFPGDEDKELNEFDVTGPVSAYGSGKLAGENFVKEFADNYFIIRTAWLYGEGKNFVRTMLGAAKTNDTVRVVKDQIGSPTSAVALANAIGTLLPTDNYGLFHGTCEGYCSWADFTSEFYRLAGLKTKVEYITTDEYPTPAKRPAFSKLDNYMLRLTTDFRFPDWHDAIAEYMKGELER